MKVSSGLVKAQASEPSEELEPELEVPDEVQDSPRLRAHCDLVAGGGNFFRAMAVEEHQKVQTAAV